MLLMAATIPACVLEIPQCLSAIIDSVRAFGGPLLHKDLCMAVTFVTERPMSVSDWH